MTTYPFGKAIQREYYPVRDVDGIATPFPLYSANASIYLFDELPARDAAISGIGAIANGTAWSVNASTTPYACTYSFNALSDPDPQSSETAHRYWESLNVLLENGTQVQTILRSFLVERPRGLPEVPTTTIEDLKGVFPSLDAYLSDQELTEMLSLAEESLKMELLRNRIQWSKVVNLRVLKLALAYKCLIISATSQIRNAGDRHDRRYAIWTTQYKEIMNGLELYQDVDGDGTPETVTRGSPGYYVLSK